MSNLKGSTLNIHFINCIVKLKFFYLNLSLPRVTKEEFVFFGFNIFSTLKDDEKEKRYC